MSKFNGTPKCNHCNYQFDDEDTWHGSYTVGEVHFDEDTQSDLKCPNCGETFHVVCEHHYHFKNTHADGEEL